MECSLLQRSTIHKSKISSFQVSSNGSSSHPVTRKQDPRLINSPFACATQRTDPQVLGKSSLSRRSRKSVKSDRHLYPNGQTMKAFHFIVVLSCSLSVSGFVPQSMGKYGRASVSQTKPSPLRRMPPLYQEPDGGSFDVSSGTPMINVTDVNYDRAVGVNGDATATLRKPPFPVVIWKFTRPHTLIGSALAVPALHIYASSSLKAALTQQNLISILYAVLPSLLMNLYVTGLNQVTDVAIDKVNKPHLPIAAGILSRPAAITTCIVALVVSLAFGVAHPLFGSNGLNVTLWGSFILGTIYSLKPFRLKRFPLLAAVCIVAVRGTIINAGFYAHAKTAGLGLGPTSFLSCLMNDVRCSLSTLYFGIFGLVIALMKDVPDVLGDRLANIRTMSVRVGPKNMFQASRYILMGLFWSTSAAFSGLAAKSNTVQRGFVALCAMGAGISMHVKAKQVDPTNPGMVYKYYMHLWLLFYLSYAVLPFAR